MEALKFMQTDEGVITQFRALSNMLYGDDEPSEFSTATVEAFFQRMSGYSVLVIFNQYAALPEFLDQIVPRYLIWQIKTNRASDQVISKAYELLVRFMKIELLEYSCMRGATRVFTWIERNRVIRLGHMPAGVYQEIKTWTGFATVIGREEPPTDFDGQSKHQVLVTQAKLDGTEFFAWELKSVLKNPMSVVSGFESSLEMAAERCYRAFYHWLTKQLFIKAQAFQQGREIVLIGNNVSAQEFLKSPSRISCTVVPETQSSDREGTMFVLGWPSSRRTKRTFKIKEHHTQNSLQKKGVIYLHGGMKLDLDEDYGFYVKNPEQYVQNQVMCPKCETLGNVQSLGMKYIQGLGPLCGPCIDHLMDRSELFDGQLDRHSDGY